MTKSFDSTQPAKSPARSSAPGFHQERVNVEMFKAIELLGRKLERAENERTRLQRRLALIESAATVDEKTGKLYLPVVVDDAQKKQIAATATAPKWLMASTFFSGTVAIVALSLVLFRPAAPALTTEQLAVINSLTATRFAEINDRPWAKVQEDLTAPKKETTLAEAELPDAWTLKSYEDEAATPAQPETMPEEIAQAPEPEAEPLTPEIIETVKAVAPEPVFEQEPVVAKAVIPAPKEEEIIDITPAEIVKAQEARQKAAPKTKPGRFVAGTDIGRDSDLPANLVEVETRAMEGVPEAQHDLATLYAAGKSSPQDYKRAAYWFAKAADGGVANAHYNLGVMFQQGLGVRKDLTKAIGWYEKAAELGHPEAMYNLGIAYIEGVGVARNIDRGVSFFKRAANSGVAQAAFNLGVLYESGFVGPTDTKRASEWYQVAANQNHAEAEEALARLASAAEALTLADMVEPAAGGDEGYGEGDASMPGDTVDVKPPVFNNDLVAKIQSALIRLGYLPGSPTGMIDQKTEDAIRAWQKSTGARADGIASVELLGKLNAQK